MFKENFIKLCNERNESPSYVCRQNGIAPATFSCWTEESVPRKATLQRLASYFGVSVDYLLGSEAQDQSKKVATISDEEILKDEFEKKLIKTFRETTVDGKIKIINAAEEIKIDIEKNDLSGDQRNA